MHSWGHSYRASLRCVVSVTIAALRFCDACFSVVVFLKPRCALVLVWIYLGALSGPRPPGHHEQRDTSRNTWSLQNGKRWFLWGEYLLPCADYRTSFHCILGMWAALCFMSSGRSLVQKIPPTFFKHHSRMCKGFFGSLESVLSFSISVVETMPSVTSLETLSLFC